MKLIQRKRAGEIELTIEPSLFNRPGYEKLVALSLSSPTPEPGHGYIQLNRVEFEALVAAGREALK
jgi:hypothetical protein